MLSHSPPCCGSAKGIVITSSRDVGVHAFNWPLNRAQRVGLDVAGLEVDYAKNQGVRRSTGCAVTTELN